MTELHGHCLCGAVRITVDGPHDPRPGACHCRMCQRWSGGLFLCFNAEASGVTVTGPVSRYQSSQFAERAFCSVCGSHLWMRNTRPGDHSYDLMPGLFDDVLSAPLRSEVYSDRAMNSVHLAGDHRRATQAEYEQKNPFVQGDVS
ncbi:MAG: GFA family protein [Cereibacter sphaeroides]|uniref:GFA family protein n=1 Tax=Cereibacter sphaeroides TaxID=1063 RepID=A0A2W5TXE7_CERSP|nr:MAG: GFA family protein [Cereibacter sphaeroides]